MVSSRGIFLQSSYINHACAPNVRRSYIADFIIVRAQTDIAADTELTFGYISCLEPLSVRKEVLRAHKFECHCGVCTAEVRTRSKCLRRRKKLSDLITGMFEGSQRVPLDVYGAIFEELEKTYTSCPTEEPRQALVMPLLNLISATKAGEMWTPVVTLVSRLLFSLGFELVVVLLPGDEGKMDITRWGFLIEELVTVLLDLADAFQALRCDGCRKWAEKSAKMCYKIIYGEDRTWKDVHKGRAEVDLGESRDLKEALVGLSIR